MIKGLSERRRLPRAGKIRLGLMVQGAGGKMHPMATDYFVCPPEVTAALSLSEQPRELPIMFPSDDPDRIFAQVLKMYRRSGLFCSGDGETAKRWDESGNLKERVCPCEYLDSGECGPLATLSFLLPDVPGIGVYQIDTGNKASIVSLNTAFEQFTAMFGGLRGIPFLLKLEPAQTMRFNAEKKQMEKVMVQALRLDSPYSLRQIHEWRKALGKPVEALMPAPESEEAIDVHAEPVNHEPTREPDRDGTAGHGTPESSGHQPDPQRTGESGAPVAREAPPDKLPSEAKTEAPAELADVSLCYKWAAECGVSSDLYGKYFEAHHGVRTSDAPDAIVAREAAEFRGLGTESERLTHKAEIVRRLNVALKKRRET